MKCELVIEIKCANGLITLMKEYSIPFCPTNGMLLSDDGYNNMGYDVEFCNYNFATKILTIYLEEQSSFEETEIESSHWKHYGWTVMDCRLIKENTI